MPLKEVLNFFLSWYNFFSNWVMTCWNELHAWIYFINISYPFFPEKEKATHSSILAWSHMDRGAWWAAVHGVTQSRTQLRCLASCMHWRRKWQPTPVFLLGESQGRRRLVGCHLWGHTESDTAEMLSMHARIGEGNGSPLQCSCLENPRDGGDWWAVICGVTQSQTRLKQFSSSSSSIFSFP